MALPTKMTKGITDVSQIRWLIYGPPGVGKTSLASGFPANVLAATEKGYKALKVFKKDIKKWEDFKEFVEDLVTGDHKFKTATIDTADLLFDKCSIYVCDKLGIKHEADAEWGKGWAEVKKEFTRELNKLFQSKYGVIFISHTKTDIITTQVDEIKKTVPTLSNQARRILLPLVDTIGLMHYKTVKKRHPETGKVLSTKRRLVITFEPTEEVEAKDRMGIMPANLVLDVMPEGKKSPDKVAQVAKQNYEKIASYYG